jgi:release factor glutamine methyltransferase
MHNELAGGETLGQLLKHNAHLLANKYNFGYTSAVFEVEILLEWFLNLDIDQIRKYIIQGERTATVFGTRTVEDFNELMRKRLFGEPLQYITHTAHFYGLALDVGAGVFIPRPETETMVSLVLDFVQELTRNSTNSATTRKVTIADLCAGSGAVALALAQNLEPEVVEKIITVEKSAQAFDYLKSNCTKYGHQLVSPVLGDASEVELPVCDVAAINPPYVPSGVELPLDVRAEPKSALYGLGEDGFEIPRAIINHAAEYLRPGGYLLVEHFETQGEIAKQALELSGFSEIKLIFDLTERPRFTTAVKY